MIPIYQMVAKLSMTPTFNQLEKRILLETIEALQYNISVLEGRIEKLEEHNIDTGTRMGKLP